MEGMLDLLNSMTRIYTGLKTKLRNFLAFIQKIIKAVGTAKISGTKPIAIDDKMLDQVTVRLTKLRRHRI